MAQAKDKSALLAMINQAAAPQKNASKDEVRSQAKGLVQDRQGMNSRVAHDLVSNAPNAIGGGDLANLKDFEKA